MSIPKLFLTPYRRSAAGLGQVLSIASIWGLNPRRQGLPVGLFLSVKHGQGYWWQAKKDPAQGRVLSEGGELLTTMYGFTATAR